MRILHVLNSNKLSGAENVVADICMMFDGEYEMAYCSPNGSIRQDLEDRDVKFYPLSRMTLKEIKRVVTTFKPDIIHAHDVRATVFTALVSGKIPIISHLHGNIEDMRRLSLKSLLYMLSIRKVKKVITVSESISKDYIFKNHFKNKNLFLRNIVYTPRLEKLMSKDQKNYYFDFAYIGRLTYPKNPQRVAKVASEVLKTCSNTTFGIIGEGDFKQEMEDIFRDEGVIDRVVFTGRLAYPYKALKQAKCMLMCSRFEGTPIAALESMALGVPIVSTPVDGMVSIVNHGQTGYLCSNDKELIQAVQDLITKNNLRSKMSFASINRFRNINNEVNYREQLKSIYNNVINLSY